MPQTGLAVLDTPEARINKLIGVECLPAPITLGPDHVAWRRADLESWQARQTGSPSGASRLADSAAELLSDRNTGSGYAREPADFYREPRWCAEALFESLPDIQGPIYDPAAGAGNIPRVARAHGLEAFGSDLIDRGCPAVVSGIDFLRQAPLVENVGTIVSNPPYAVAEEFLLRSLTDSPHRVCLLLELKFLASQKRFALFKWIAPLERVLVFSKRPSMPPGRHDPEQASGGKQDYAWFVWNTTLPVSHQPHLDWWRPTAE